MGACWVPLSAAVRTIGAAHAVRPAADKDADRRGQRPGSLAAADRVTGTLQRCQGAVRPLRIRRSQCARPAHHCPAETHTNRLLPAHRPPKWGWPATRILTTRHQRVSGRSWRYAFVREGGGTAKTATGLSRLSYCKTHAKYTRWHARTKAAVTAIHPRPLADA